ncbi:MAG: hypothetical protein KJO67_01980 [Silicimonas sp.]|nr:hypothetical protein [Silicimonas sp.]
MLSETDCEAAAEIFDCHWRDGRQIDHLPEPLRPRTRSEGYRIQDALARAAGDPVHAWKIAATSAAGQAHINVDGPLAGRIFRNRVLAPGATIALSGNNMRVAELEFAFRLGRDLPPRDGGYDMASVRDAVSALHPAIEIPASRYADFTLVGAPALIADNSCAHLFVFGDAFDPSDWTDRDLAGWQVNAEVAGKGVTEGIGRNVLGDPWTALHWLVNECSEHGLPLAEGQLVSTGTCLIPVPVIEGDRLVADFGAGAPITLDFS